ncbi:MAG: hypothetical protein IKD75_04115 [Prevotella sp.]|nr:hypothetical protein [Prevotella sp.]
MTLRQITIIALALLLPLSLSAQKKKKRVVKKPVVEEPQEDPRITDMREMTQQIIIIDSIVADKKQFLSRLKLSSETGAIMSKEAVFGKSRADSTSVFVNEMGNKIYYSQATNGRQQLYTCDKLGNEWSDPQQLKGLSEGLEETAYPFMLADGITFYFAGKGEESIGGYDIFFTRYDSRSGSFLKPENMGMPFNSEANDYLYAVDEYSRIGYFVSDRRQPEGKVCIYVFIPSESRKTYDSSKYSEEQLRDLSAITRIADTWGNGADRKAALTRWKNIEKENAIKANGKKSQTALYAEFVINDALTYYSSTEFRSEEAKKLYIQVVLDRQKLDKQNKELESLRDKYAKSSKAEKKKLAPQVKKAEEDVKYLYYLIKKRERQARNEENLTINK